MKRPRAITLALTTILAGLALIGALKPATAARAVPETAADGSLVGHWRFDGSDGRTVKDRSLKGNDGSIVFGELRREKAGTSLELDGLGGHVMIRRRTPLELADALTAAVWVKPLRLRTNTVLFGVPNVNESWTTPEFGMYVSPAKKAGAG